MGDELLWVVGQGRKVDLGHGYIIPEYIRANIGRWGWGQAVAFESSENGRKYSHNQVLNNSQAFAAALINFGPELNLKRMNVVAIMLKNVPEFTAIAFGIWEAGLVTTLINPSSTEHEISNQLEITSAKVIITSPQFLSVARAIREKNALITSIIIVGDNPNEIFEDCLNYFQMLTTDTTGVDFFTGSQLTTDNDVATIAFSSGTSGLPKGVLLTHSAILSNAILFSHPDFLFIKKFEGENEQDRIIAILPFFHIYGFIATSLTSMIQGCHVITMSAFSPTTFIENIRKFKPTFLILVPTLVSFLCNTDSIVSSDLEQIRCIFSGAAPVGEVLMKQIQIKAKNALFVEGYGLTEVAGALVMPRFHRPGSIGTPYPGVIAKIIDIDSGATLGEGEHGELCVMTPTIMKGYLNNERATKECIDEEGWFHTGDIAYYDKDGCFFIVGRLKEMIKVKGYQVAPAELEDIIRSHEGVKDVAVIGILDVDSGEIPLAFVVQNTGQGPDEKLTEGEIMDFVKSRVSSYKRLRGGVRFVEEIPKAGSGKILRRVLKEMYNS